MPVVLSRLRENSLALYPGCQMFRIMRGKCFFAFQTKICLDYWHAEEDVCFTVRIYDGTYCAVSSNDDALSW